MTDDEKETLALERAESTELASAINDLIFERRAKPNVAMQALTLNLGMHISEFVAPENRPQVLKLTNNVLNHTIADFDRYSERRREAEKDTKTAVS